MCDLMYTTLGETPLKHLLENAFSASTALSPWCLKVFLHQEGSQDLRKHEKARRPIRSELKDPNLIFLD